MNDMNKIVFIGNNEQNHRVFCRIRIKDGNLSITGVESPLSNGDCLGSAGQIVTNYKEASSHIVSYAKGWNEVMFKRFIDVWDKWHLNDMVSHCEHVDLIAYNKELEVKGKMKAALWVYPSEHPEGYLTRECPVCGYKQGTKWLKRELPVDVIEFLASLPETTVTPAWV